MASPSTEAMDSPTESFKNVKLSNHDNPKSSILDLPQELRDHIFSFLPSTTTTGKTIHLSTEKSHKSKRNPIRLAAVCRTFRHDILSTFCSKNSFSCSAVLLTRAPRRGLCPCPWGDEFFGYINDLEVVVARCLDIDGVCLRAAEFRVVREGGRYRVSVGISQASSRLVGCTEARLQAVQKSLEVKSQAFTDQVELELNKTGITLDVIRTLNQFRAKLDY